MTNEESRFPVYLNEISSSDDDKKFVSQGVAFVIGHTRNGFVSLCAGVASVLKDQAKLRLENEALRKEIALLKRNLSTLPSGNNAHENSGAYINQVTSSLIGKRTQHSHLSNYKKLKRKDLKVKKFRSLIGCLCERCSQVPGALDALSVPLEVGDKVVISGEICGQVQYVGHIDSFCFPEIFIGLLLDEAVGDSNGTIGEKMYFTAPPSYGLIVPLYNVSCIIN